jgi:D-glycero-alpha-D-manno-heptose 1-phosphate guanylyltransferase
MKISEAIILAGGLGTRLRSAVPDLPKCMAPVSGKPFIHYVVDHFQKQGIEKFIFSLGYKHEIIIDYLEKIKNTFFNSNAQLTFQYSIEEEPLGTGGAVKLACGKATETTALVLNGDTLFNIKLSKLAPFHHMSGSHCTLSLKPMQNFDRYGVVELNTDYSIKSFMEKQWYENGLINGGVYALHAVKFMEEIFPEKFSFEKDYLEKFYSTRHMFGVIQDEYFIDIGIPEDYAKANSEL